MSGLDKMKNQILDEANHSAEAKIAEAKAKAEEIIQAAKAEAEEEAGKISQKSGEAVAIYGERVKSSCDMQRKKALLQAKQELIRGVLEKAQAQILSLDPPAYFDMIREMLKKYAQPEAGTIRFSKKDLERMPEGFETEIQNIAGEKGGSLALEKDPADLDGGFILIYGGIEENCTIGAMFEAKRDELSDCVHKVMFA